MTNPLPCWPVKTCELHTHYFESARWNDFRFHDDDIVTAAYAKPGATWMQQIVAKLLFGGAESLNVRQMSR